MVRAGVVEHPRQWEFCGYNEIQNPRKRKGIIDFDRLMDLLGFNNYDDLKDAHSRWVDSEIWNQPIDRLRIYRPPSSLIGQFLHEN
jgi:hypothetical protein